MVMRVQWREGQEVTGHFGVTAGGVAGCLYVRFPRLSHVWVRVRVLLRANVDGCVRGE